jgi:hypothetical protein
MALGLKLPGTCSCPESATRDGHMLIMKPVDHEPDPFAIVLNVCRFCGRSAKRPYWGLKERPGGR